MKTQKSKPALLIFLSAAFLLLTSISLSAQKKSGDNPEQNKKERIKSMKVAYISDRLKLSSTEAEKFWPLYNEFQDKRDAFQKENRKKMSVLKETKVENLTEEQAEEIIKSELQHEQNQLELKKEYYPKFKNVIGNKKVVGLYRAEKDFNRLLLEKLKDDKPRPEPEE